MSRDAVSFELIMEFYNAYSEEFSRTRFRIWPCVRTFLDSFPSGTKLLDIGCGNGKYMKVRPEFQTIGIESSAALCKLCSTQGLEVVCGDARSLAFPDATFDAVIMIAVLHHIPPSDHAKVLCEIQRVLKHGGRCLITNWAVEQPADARRKFETGLNIVQWKGAAVGLPYWIMDAELARDFAAGVPGGLICDRTYLEAGNWVFTLTKGLPT
jgi:SAM-dependent methyltransferase